MTANAEGIKVVDLLCPDEVERWTFAEIEAWHANDPGLFIFNFGPLGKKALGQWSALEDESLRTVASGKTILTPELWGFVALNIFGKKRTGCQCLTRAKDLNFDKGENLSEAWISSQRAAAEITVQELRSSYSQISEDISSVAVTATSKRIEVEDGCLITVASRLNAEGIPISRCLITGVSRLSKTEGMVVNGDKVLETANDEEDLLQPRIRRRNKPLVPPKFLDFAIPTPVDDAAVIANEPVNYCSDDELPQSKITRFKRQNTEIPLSATKKHEIDGDELGQSPGPSFTETVHDWESGVDGLADNGNSITLDADASNSSFPASPDSQVLRRKKRVIQLGSSTEDSASEREVDNMDIEDSDKDGSIIDLTKNAGRCTAQELYTKVKQELIQSLLDESLVLMRKLDERKTWFLVLENEFKEVENLAYSLLQKLRKDYGVRDPFESDNNFLNGWSNSEKAQIPSGMSRERYDELTSLTKSQSRELLGTTLRQARDLYDKLCCIIISDPNSSTGQMNQNVADGWFDVEDEDNSDSDTFLHDGDAEERGEEDGRDSSKHRRKRVKNNSSRYDEDEAIEQVSRRHKPVGESTGRKNRVYGGNSSRNTVTFDSQLKYPTGKPRRYDQNIAHLIDSDAEAEEDENDVPVGTENRHQRPNLNPKGLDEASTRRGQARERVYGQPEREGGGEDSMRTGKLSYRQNLGRMRAHVPGGRPDLAGTVIGDGFLMPNPHNVAIPTFMPRQRRGIADLGTLLQFAENEDHEATVAHDDRSSTNFVRHFGSKSSTVDSTNKGDAVEIMESRSVAAKDYQQYSSDSSGATNSRSEYFLGEHFLVAEGRIPTPTLQDFQAYPIELRFPLHFHSDPHTLASDFFAESSLAKFATLDQVFMVPHWSSGTSNSPREVMFALAAVPILDQSLAPTNEAFRFMDDYGNFIQIRLLDWCLAIGQRRMAALICYFFIHDFLTENLREFHVNKTFDRFTTSFGTGKSANSGLDYWSTIVKVCNGFRWNPWSIVNAILSSWKSNKSDVIRKGRWILPVQSRRSLVTKLKYDLESSAESTASSNWDFKEIANDIMKNISSDPSDVTSRRLISADESLLNTVELLKWIELVWTVLLRLQPCFTSWFSPREFSGSYATALVPTDNLAWLVDTVLPYIHGVKPVIESQSGAQSAVNKSWEAAIRAFCGVNFNSLFYLDLTIQRCARYLQLLPTTVSASSNKQYLAPTFLNAILNATMTIKSDDPNALSDFSALNLTYMHFVEIFKQEMKLFPTSGARLRFGTELINRASQQGPRLQQHPTMIERVAFQCSALALLLQEEEFKGQIGKISKNICSLGNLLDLVTFAPPVSFTSSTTFGTNSSFCEWRVDCIRRIASSLTELAKFPNLSFATEQFCTSKRDGKWRSVHSVPGGATTSNSFIAPADVLLNLTLKLLDELQTVSTETRVHLASAAGLVLDALSVFIRVGLDQTQQTATSPSNRNMVMHLLVPIVNAFFPTYSPSSSSFSSPASSLLWENCPSLIFQAIDILSEFVQTKRSSLPPPCSEDATAMDEWLLTATETSEWNSALERNLSVFAKSSFSAFLRDQLCKSSMQPSDIIPKIRRCIEFAASLAALSYSNSSASSSTFHELVGKFGTYDRWTSILSATAPSSEAEIKSRETFFLVPALFLVRLARELGPEVASQAVDPTNLLGAFWLAFLVLGGEFRENDAESTLFDLVSLYHAPNSLSWNQIVDSKYGLQLKCLDVLDTLWRCEGCKASHYWYQLQMFLAEIPNIENDKILLSRLVTLASWFHATLLGYAMFRLIICSELIGYDRNPGWSASATKLLPLVLVFLRECESKTDLQRYFTRSNSTLSSQQDFKRLQIFLFGGERSVVNAVVQFSKLTSDDQRLLRQWVFENKQEPNTQST